MIKKTIIKNPEKDIMIEDIGRIMYEIEKEKHDIRKVNKWKKRINHPFSVLLMLILVFLIIMMIVPYRAIKLDPVPKNIPSLEEILPLHIRELANNHTGLDKEIKSNYNLLIIPSDANIRTIATRIATSSCIENNICYAKAIFYFVRDNLEYVGDPPNGYLESPFEVLYHGGADCDGLTILLANLEIAIGVPSRLVFVPDHVFLQIKLNDAPKKYKNKDSWISLDPACRNCEFGELSFKTFNQKKKYVYLS